MSTPTGPHGRDERRVRDALHDTVDDLEPVAGLPAIRSRLQEDAMNRTHRARPALLALGGAAAVAVVVAGVVLVTQDTGRTGSTAPPAASTSPDTSASTTATGTTQPTPTAPASPSDDPRRSDPAAPVTTRTLPIYYVGDTPAGPRLFREFRRVRVQAGEDLTVALQQAVGTPALDPDYGTPWPSGTRIASAADASSADGVITVSLTGDLHDRPAGTSRDDAEMAVQQLVYTAQAVEQTRAPVQLLLDGKHTDTLLGVPVSEPLANGDEMSTLASVWITSPQDGDTLEAGGVRVTGLGAFFEATVSWQLLQGDHVVKDGSAMARECCKRSPFDFTIPAVAPGDYVLRVYDADMSDGEGPGEAQDTKRITVR